MPVNQRVRLANRLVLLAGGTEIINGTEKAAFFYTSNMSKRRATKLVCPNEIDLLELTASISVSSL